MLELPFDRIVIVSLKHSAARLEALLANLAECEWPLNKTEICLAIDGTKLPIPAAFRSSSGAFGCRQSHVAVLQRALCDDVSSLLVLEDDAVVRPDIAEKFRQFWHELPHDWDGVMLGGEHLDPPISITPALGRCMRTVRTHAYACKPPLMRVLYKAWLESLVDIDWVLADFQRAFRVYAPNPFLVGQRAGYSSIAQVSYPTRYWNPPDETRPLLVCQTTAAVAATLANSGHFYFGPQLNTQNGVDQSLRALCLARGNENRRLKLKKFVYEMQRVCTEHSSAAAQVYGLVRNPGIPLSELVNRVRDAGKGPVHGILAANLSEFWSRLPSEIEVPRGVNA